MANVRRYTQAQLTAEIAAILKEYPALDGYDPTSACCAGCASTEVGREFGWDAAEAWDRLQDLCFLLGTAEE